MACTRYRTRIERRPIAIKKNQEEWEPERRARVYIVYKASEPSQNCECGDTCVLYIDAASMKVENTGTWSNSRDVVTPFFLYFVSNTSLFYSQPAPADLHHTPKKRATREPHRSIRHFNIGRSQPRVNSAHGRLMDRL